MKRCLVALAVSVLSLTTGVSLAAAATPTLGIQTVDQSASSSQAAAAASGAAQVNPSNTNISVRVLSPGNDGPVSQTNSVDSDAKASNSNSSTQDATQSQSGAGSTGACCPSGSTGIQSASQAASNQQLAAALSSATQTGASNTNVPVRVGSPGNDGPVSQTNSVDSNASAKNENAASQAADQEQSAGGAAPVSAPTATCCPAAPSLGVQTIDQKAGNEQAALAGSSAKQENPENVNVSVRVLSPGNGGSVSQTNSVDSDATARNSNDADQSAAQTQSSGGSSTGACCPSGATGIQTANQGAWNGQAALAGSKAEQSGASNTNASIRVLSPGNDGPVWQENSVESDAKASNRNSSNQEATQNQASGSGSGLGIQIAGQESKNEQAALAGSIAKQEDAKNSNTPIRVLSPGNGGSVVQSNTVDSDAKAKNSNEADQSATQTQSAGGSTRACCPSGATGIQVAGQSAKNEQLAIGLSAAIQEGASNKNAPVRVLSPGNDGPVWQENSVESDAKASNRNSATQDATQTQSSGGTGMSACCPSGGLGVQVVGQEAKNHQGAAALSAAFQAGASNENKPLRVLSPGNDGSVVQSNSVDSDATAKNRNEVDQTADQTQRGGGSSNCRCPSGAIGIQALGQSSWSSQGALAASFAAQKPGRSKCGCPAGPSNVNDPVRVLSPGNGGPVWQENTVESDAKAKNSNDVDQTASQTQSGAGGAQIGIQAAGQAAANHQLAAALSAALQIAPKNSNKPVAVKSPGSGGSTRQLNDADSDAFGGNRNHPTQLSRQIAM